MASQLPDDLIDLIINNLSYKRDFLSCSLVNRSWFPHAQSRLFMAFHCSHHVTNSCPTPSSCTNKIKKLEEIVRKSPHIAHYVRTLRIFLHLRWDETAGSYTPGTFCTWESVSFLVPQMTSLREIQIINTQTYTRILDWSGVPQQQADVLLDCIRRPSLCLFRLEGISNFPINPLSEARSLVSLALHNAGVSLRTPQFQPSGVEEADDSATTTPVPSFSLQKFFFQGADEAAGRINAARLMTCLINSGASPFTHLRRLTFSLRRSENLFLVSVLNQSGASLKDLVLDIIDTISQEACVVMQNLTSLENLTITFNNLPNSNAFRNDMTKILYFLSKADCPLRKIHLILKPELYSQFQINNDPWGDVDNGMSYWIDKRTLGQVYIGCVGLHHVSQTPGMFLHKSLERVAASGILNTLLL
ncbi:hypothetical protein BDN72DRAFT_961117 [Pluteus cervinus]|uniref:Uncharacterized protein n=1 Tax=Pluteus cervinus TaxID=181527 RepID=A0ACD3APP1_9AGAR|nr:hypothetical protein BDN72DRAFT_961117 [Pluteus cervinus]